ncbi:hypothetical protein [Natronosalvus vescus]|uniref:hypothetical protein n=1 Tax=Natronosalvus vescus TaxID=2953881 RepID=UPI002090B4D5|nr:hypothetical protein [Natronosalvus vescus]
MSEKTSTEADGPIRATAAAEPSDDPSSVDSRGARSVLTRVRTERRPHVIALALAVVVGLAFSWLHWLGLIVGGALVGLCARRLSIAVAYGIAFGALVLVAFALSLGGISIRALEMAPAIYLTLGAGIGLPALGALARGVV